MVNVIQQRAKRWNESGGVISLMPRVLCKQRNSWNMFVRLEEAVAETSEEFMDRYFGGEAGVFG